MSEPVSEGIVAEVREERVQQEEEHEQQQRVDGFHHGDGHDVPQHAAASAEHASTSASPQQHEQQQQQVRRPSRPTLRDNTEWKDEIKVGYRISHAVLLAYMLIALLYRLSMHRRHQRVPRPHTSAT